MIFDNTANTAAQTSAHIVCLFELVSAQNEEAVVAVYKPHADTEYRYSSHVFSAGEKPTDREFGVNGADNYSLLALLNTLNDQYGTALGADRKP
jgi:hypothetical protein